MTPFTEVQNKLWAIPLGELGTRHKTKKAFGERWQKVLDECGWTHEEYRKEVDERHEDFTRRVRAMTMANQMRAWGRRVEEFATRFGLDSPVSASPDEFERFVGLYEQWWRGELME